MQGTLSSAVNPTPREYAAKLPGFFAALRMRDRNFAIRSVKGARPMTLPDERYRSPAAASLTLRPTTGGHRGSAAILPWPKALAVAGKAGRRRRQLPNDGTATAVRFSDSAERVACAEWLELVAIGYLVTLVRWRQATNRRRALA